MTKRRLIWSLVAGLILAFYVVTPAQTPGPPHTYTCYWTHDGTNADDSYRILVDSVATVATVPLSACTVVNTTRSCTSPLTMTTNVSHVVTVQAVNIFGEATSPPFAADPPKSPAGVGVR